MGEKKKSVADIDPALLKRLEKSLSELKEDIVEGSTMQELLSSLRKVENHLHGKQ